VDKNFELEKRSLVEVDDLEKVISFLDAQAKLDKTFTRFSIIFWDHADAQPAENSNFDFRIRIANNQGLFTLKYGDWRGGEREEYEFHFDLDELSQVVHMMRVQGNKWGTTTHVQRRKYSYQGFEIVADKYLDDGRGIIEIEKICHSEEDFKIGELQIDQIFAEWKMTPLSSDEMVHFVRYTNAKQENYFDLEGKGVDFYIQEWKKKIQTAPSDN
jgi:adenylate cyclase class IV